MRKLSRRKLLKLGLGAGLVGCFGEALSEPNRVESIQFRFPVRDLPKEFEGLRIGVMSDIHWGHVIDREFMRRASEQLLAMKPDIVAIPGDFYHGQVLTPANAPSLAGAFDALGSVPQYGVLGNHDHMIGRSFVEDQLAKYTKIQLLDNRGTLLSRGSSKLALGGVGDLWKGHIDLAAAFADVPEDAPRILLAHNPDVAEFMPNDKGTRVDLQISGHTHGGQIVIPHVFNPYQRISEYGAKFNRGLVEGARHPVFVSKGLAKLNHPRFCALPDVACIELVRKAWLPVAGSLGSHLSPGSYLTDPFTKG